MERAQTLVTGEPKRFGPGVPLRKPSSIRSQIAPMIGISPISTHQPDLSRSWKRLIWTKDEPEPPLLPVYAARH
jgi:hypothetical protein